MGHRIVLTRRATQQCFMFLIFIQFIKIMSYIVLGNALICQKCRYSLKQPKAEQKCDPNNIVICTTGYCVTAKYTDKNGTVHFGRNCDTTKPEQRICPNTEQACSKAIKMAGYKACVAACCRTDNCNNFTAGSATGIIVTKFTFILMVIAGLVA